ncbi:MAG: phosphatase PAP2 family protein [Prochloraceae cyanobacterium]|nr:phosphatase PAP2 family protein [Prochloraceae cyanobacterium]
MYQKKVYWIGSLAFIVVLLIGASQFAYFLGDVTLTNLVQFLTPNSEGWAKWITGTAKMPLRLILLGITIALAWFLSGWAASILSMISFGVSFALGDFLLKPWVARPRPDPELINVVGSPSGFSMPSTFGVIYASTLGFILLLTLTTQKRSQIVRLLIGAICSLLLLIGLSARVTLGAHWPSDVIVAYLIAFMWGLFLIEIILPNFSKK